MRPDELPSILDELLKLAPRLLRLLNRGQPRCMGLVLRKLRADQIQHRSDSLLELYVVCLPGIPTFDQVLDVLLGVGLEHYDQFQAKRKANSQQHSMSINTLCSERSKRILAVSSRFLPLSSSPTLRSTSSARARSWSSWSLSFWRCSISSSRPKVIIVRHKN